MNRICHNKPSLGLEESEAVTKVLQSNWLIAGVQVEQFELNIKQFTGTKYAIALNSGTSALHLALIALGVAEGDEVILPTFTVADVLSAVCYTRAKPVLVDIERNGVNADADQIKKNITEKTKAIIIPHMFGSVAQIEEIKKYGIPIIEDCAQAIGTTYKNKPVGGFGDIGIFSFYATKTLSIGQGGMLVTNNKKYYQYIRDIINYNGPDSFRVRYNYPMTDIAASIGNVQLKKLPAFIKRRRHIASRYISALDSTSIDYFPKKENLTNVCPWRFILKFDNIKKRDRAKRKFDEKAITAICPLRQCELLHSFLKLDKKNFSRAEEMAKTSLSIPLYPSLTEVEVERTVAVLEGL